MRVAIRADASRLIGSGHWVRCLSLAQALRAQAADVVLATRDVPPHLAAQAAAAGVALLPLPGRTDARTSAEDVFPADVQQQDIDDLRQALAGGPRCDWIVVDHYGLDARWEAQAATLAPHVMAIDDLARVHQCALLLDQNFYLDAGARYDGRVPADCTLLLGPRFALLRPAFAAARAAVAPRDGPVRRLHIFLGGMDRDNVTEWVLRAAAGVVPAGVQIDVVIGSTHPARASIEALVGAWQGARLHVDTPDMPALLAAADLAIGAGGTATWERCALGVPTLAVCIAENQRELLGQSARGGLVCAPDDAMASAEIFAGHLRALLGNSGLRNHLSRAGLALTDGAGAGRVAQRMKEYGA